MNSVTFINITTQTPKKSTTSINSNQTVPPGYLVWSPGCQMPAMDPLAKDVMSLFTQEKFEACSSSKPLTQIRYNWTAQTVELVLDQKLKNTRAYARSLCCYHEIRRSGEGKQADEHFKWVVGHLHRNYTSIETDHYSIAHCRLGDCVTFGKTVELPMTIEYILVKCKGLSGKSVYDNTHAIIRERAAVRQKLDEATLANNRTRPLSVLMLSIDSISRLNLIRAMPRTAQHLYDHGWFELQGYNKVSFTTLSIFSIWYLSCFYFFYFSDRWQHVPKSNGNLGGLQQHTGLQHVRATQHRQTRPMSVRVEGFQRQRLCDGLRWGRSVDQLLQLPQIRLYDAANGLLHAPVHVGCREKSQSQAQTLADLLSGLQQFRGSHLPICAGFRHIVQERRVVRSVLDEYVQPQWYQWSIVDGCENQGLCARVGASRHSQQQHGCVLQRSRTTFRSRAPSRHRLAGRAVALHIYLAAGVVSRRAPGNRASVENKSKSLDKSLRFAHDTQTCARTVRARREFPEGHQLPELPKSLQRNAMESIVWRNIDRQPLVHLCTVQGKQQRRQSRAPSCALCHRWNQQRSAQSHRKWAANLRRIDAAENLVRPESWIPWQTRSIRWLYGCVCRTA